MITLTGQLINVFVQPKGEKDGKEYGGQDKLQVIGDIDLPDGGKRVDMFTLTTRDIGNFKEFIGKKIRIPIGIFLAGRSQITYFIPQGSKPELVRE